jgi:hypothetical protein
MTWFRARRRPLGLDTSHAEPDAALWRSYPSASAAVCFRHAAGVDATQRNPTFPDDESGVRAFLPVTR